MSVGVTGHMVNSLLFWGSFVIVTYIVLGFPLLTAIRGFLWHRPVRHGTGTPPVSVIVAAYNEARVIEQKVKNTLALDYPRDCLELIIASDGSDDGTDDLVTAISGPEVKLLSLPRRGKNLTLNDAVAAASGEILVFTDADTMLAPDALRHLTAPFDDPEVGGVAGDYRQDKKVGAGASERDFWDFERRLKHLQSRAGSVTSAWGPIYAIRRSFFTPIPVGVTDDYFTSVQPLLAHRRLVFEPLAVASGPVAGSAQHEFRRKVRIIAAGLRGVWKTRRLLNPFEYGFLAIQLFSHKVLRRLMGLPLLVLVVSAPLLWSEGWFYRLMAVSQLGFYAAALVGFLLRSTSTGRYRALRLPFFFTLVYTAAIVALISLIRGSRHDIWTPETRGSE